MVLQIGKIRAIDGVIKMRVHLGVLRTSKVKTMRMHLGVPQPGKVGAMKVNLGVLQPDWDI